MQLQAPQECHAMNDLTPQQTHVDRIDLTQSVEWERRLWT